MWFLQPLMRSPSDGLHTGFSLCRGVVQIRTALSENMSDGSVCDWGEFIGDWTPNTRLHPQGLADVRAAAEAAGKTRCAALGADGLGLMLLDEAAETLTPLVYIPCGDTLYWEHSCASGSAATANYLASLKEEKVFCSFQEPGGVIRVSAAPGGEIVLYNKVVVRD